MRKTKNNATQPELEYQAAAFRRLVSHLRNRTDVQNIDLMNLGGFCRNCLSRWYAEAAEEHGIEMQKDIAKEIIYGMPHSVWKEKYQTDANEDQENKFQSNRQRNH